MIFAITPSLAFADPVANATPKYAREIESVVTQVSPAIVQVDFSGKRTKTGVIISADGVIATGNNGRKVSDKDERASVRLADGRQLAAARLGWSGEWRVELLQIDHGSQVRWPHVSIDHDAKVVAGQPCILLGYPRNDNAGESKLSVRSSSIEQSTYPHWCVTSEDKLATQGGLFDLRGNFLGLTTRTRWPSHTCTSLFLRYRSELTQGLNLDRERFAGNKSSNSPSHSEDATALIHAATVRVYHKKKQSSGVVISGDGYVITCAHGTLKGPGEKVVIAFSNGKEIPGRVINSNPISDIALIKLEGDGPWKFVALGSSVTMQSGDGCFVSGYPHGYSGVKPVIKETQVLEPSDLEWSHLLWTSDYGLQGGESGGGIFDTEGRMIGLIHGYRVAPKPRAAFHARAEMIRQQLPLLQSVSSNSVRPIIPNN